MTFAIARYPTPVLNTAAFRACFGAHDGSSLPLDEEQLLRPIEMVLLPHSKVELIEKMDDTIWKIRTAEHPSEEALYVDERFLTHVDASFPERTRLLPPVEEVMKLLQQQIGARYIWGGNWPQGIPQLLHWYRPKAEVQTLSSLLLDTWQLKGVDCSGLLYFATAGNCPRNTAQLVSWGEQMSIEGKSVEQIIAMLKPLDLIVWKGHVLIALNKKTLIESRGGSGVVTTPAIDRLHEIIQTHKPVDSYTFEEPCFVARRWHPEGALKRSKTEVYTK